MGGGQVRQIRNIRMEPSGKKIARGGGGGGGGGADELLSVHQQVASCSKRGAGQQLLYLPQSLVAFPLLLSYFASG